MLVSVIADASTVTGLLLTGIGKRDAKGRTNFMIVDKDTPKDKTKEFLKSLLDREDIGVVFISQNAAEDVRETIIEHDKVFPTIMEIPSKETVYEAEKDFIVQKAAAVLWGSETGAEKIKEKKAQYEFAGNH